MDEMWVRGGGDGGVFVGYGVLECDGVRLEEHSGAGAELFTELRGLLNAGVAEVADDGDACVE